ncbi:epsin [Impatiens glandulifera]|uniref:epsin n=1 Tax=Impatiens glandulifera TaxID=253017 RepID=UPI001FB14ACB|nr:epsin [Impatiens glandulifera]
MNSNYRKSSTNSDSLNSFNFDLGLGSNRSRPLNEQKNSTQPHAYTSSSSFPSNQPNARTTPSWQPRPSWTHQPAPNQPARPNVVGAQNSMVGDIFGKSWTSSKPSGAPSVGIVNKDPNLFGDLVTSAMGQDRANSNVPLKNTVPPSKNAYSMGKISDSLPKVDNASNWNASETFGSFTGGAYCNTSNSTQNTNSGGPSLRNIGGGGGGGGMSANKDPFASLADFGSKPMGTMHSLGKGTKASSEDNAFGSFQNAPKSITPGFSANDFAFSSSSYQKMDDFSVPSSKNPPPPVQSSGVDAFDSLFSSSSTAAATTGNGQGGSLGTQSQQFSAADDWGFDSDIGGGNDTGGTTEIEGLPPPPAGVSASTANSKGMDNYKQGQYADAIKWLSWAIILLEKAGDDIPLTEALSSRASCYKEVGEYKKAVADCTKVLENDAKNIAVLVQRALLYESMEKYKLGAEDLRTVMKLDPGNRVAKSTIHRLTKMAG